MTREPEERALQELLTELSFGRGRGNRTVWPRDMKPADRIQCCKLRQAAAKEILRRSEVQGVPVPQPKTIENLLNQSSEELAAREQEIDKRLAEATDQS